MAAPDRCAQNDIDFCCKCNEEEIVAFATTLTGIRLPENLPGPAAA
jgi:hypothetical protein